MKKRILSCVISMVMAICLCHAAYATVDVDPNGFGSWIIGWAGSGSTAFLRGYGAGENLKVGTNPPADSLGKGGDIWGVESVGNGEYVIYCSSNCYVNMYRVLQNGSYYLCTGFPYENETGGRDQRVNLLQYSGANPAYTIIKLARPVIGGNWYMMADYSQPVPSSDVVWYTNPNLIKARWA